MTSFLTHRHRTKKARTRSRSSLAKFMVYAFLTLLLLTLVWTLCIHKSITMNSNDNANANNSESAFLTSFISPSKKRPFLMPEVGNAYEIYQPVYDMDKSKLGNVLFAPPSQFIKSFSERHEWLHSITKNVIDETGKKNMPILQKAQEMYLEFLISFLSATAFNDAESQLKGSMHANKVRIQKFDASKRKGGKDWTYLGDTMVGNLRLHNIWNLLQDVSKNNIPGDYMETGVWRGGASVFARAILNTLGETDRVSYVCDSFAGLPPGDRALDAADKGWDDISFYLSVPDEIVATNFQKMGMLDSNVVFVKGFFNETMPPLSKHVDKMAVMRLDGDMYESTVDVLYHFYDKMSIGGYVIMDDWFGFPSRTAVEDFFKVHGISPAIIAIDSIAAYWKKTEEIQIQYWRYEQNKFKPDDVASKKE
mmetsp:Transcript_22353/g.33022  ORF Transcript_22353/g.33022 Transcript_22353/m.33022 type:complete len:422 (-) Transcript_22353:780-2045(-)